jgi:TolA-binding protein
MIRRGLVAAAALLAVISLTPSPSFGASKEIQELQRDVAQLQDMVRQLQTSQDQKLVEIRTLVQQSLAAANDANRAVAVIQSSIQQSLRDQESKVVAPVVGLTTRMDGVSNDVRALQQSMADLSSSIAKIQAQLTDVNNAVKVIQSPPPPPGQTGTTTGAGPGMANNAAPAGTDTPTMSLTDLYNAANNDRQGGKFDLALQEYGQLLRWYGNTDLAPNAQYYIAWIHASQGDYDSAVKEYDMVLEKYPDNNNKMPDAFYGKGLALAKLGRRTEANREFQELRKRFPNNALAQQACKQIVALGYQCGSARAASPKGKRRK